MLGNILSGIWFLLLGLIVAFGVFAGLAWICSMHKLKRVFQGIAYACLILWGVETVLGLAASLIYTALGFFGLV